MDAPYIRPRLHTLTLTLSAHPQRHKAHPASAHEEAHTHRAQHTLKLRLLRMVLGSMKPQCTKGHC